MTNTPIFDSLDKIRKESYSLGLLHGKNETRDLVLVWLRSVSKPGVQVKQLIEKVEAL